MRTLTGDTEVKNMRTQIKIYDPQVPCQESKLWKIQIKLNKNKKIILEIKWEIKH